MTFDDVLNAFGDVLEQLNPFQHGVTEMWEMPDNDFAKKDKGKTIDGVLASSFGAFDNDSNNVEREEYIENPENSDANVEEQEDGTEEKVETPQADMPETDINTDVLGNEPLATLDDTLSEDALINENILENEVPQTDEIPEAQNDDMPVENDNLGTDVNIDNDNAVPEIPEEMPDEVSDVTPDEAPDETPQQDTDVSQDQPADTNEPTEISQNELQDSLSDENNYPDNQDVQAPDEKSAEDTDIQNGVKNENDEIPEISFDTIPDASIPENDKNDEAPDVESPNTLDATEDISFDNIPEALDDSDPKDNIDVDNANPNADIDFTNIPEAEEAPKVEVSAGNAPALQDSLDDIDSGTDIG